MRNLHNLAPSAFGLAIFQVVDTMKPKQLVGLCLVTLTIVVLLVASQVHPFQLYPGLEGLDAGVVGYQIKEPSEAMGYYQTNEQFPDGDLNPRYEWTQYPTVDPYNTRINKHWVQGEWLQTQCDKNILVERQTPTRDTTLEGRKVEYWLDIGEDKRKHIVGTVVPWTFKLAISMHGDYHSIPAFEDGEGVWFGLGTKRWDRAYPDPDNTDVYSNAGFSIPLAVYIEEFEDAPLWHDDENNWKKPERAWIDECVDVTPSLSGRTITLFNDPITPVTLDDVWYQGGMSSSAVSDALAALNSSLSPNPYPDSEFQSHCYFKISFERFAVFQEKDFWGSVTATWFPAIEYRLRVYYLELGEFIYTQEEDEIPPWEPRGWTVIFSPVWYWWEDFFEALNMVNPFRVFGPWAPFVAFLFLLFLIAVGILICVAIFAPHLLARGARSVGRARYEYKAGKAGK